MSDQEYELKFASLQESMDIGWLLSVSPLVLFLMMGIILYESGSVRIKNMKYVLLKNTVGCLMSAVCFWAWGYGFAFGRKDGEPSNAFIGNDAFFGTDVLNSDKPHYFYTSMAAGVSCLLATSTVAERVHLHVYCVWQFLYLSWIHPVVVHWMLAPEGWLRRMGVSGPLDYAGAGYLHLLAGASGLAANIIVGPRLGRYSRKGRLKKMEGYSATMVTLGTFIMWTGWFSLNFGAARNLVTLDQYKYVGLVAVNTFIAPSFCSLAVLYYYLWEKKMYDLNEFLRGIIAGLVSISGAAATVEPWAAFIIGMVGALAYILGQKLCEHPLIRIDDPTNFVSILLMCGFWGMISTSLFSSQSNMAKYLRFTPGDYGAFYGGGGQLLGLNLLAAVVIIAWSMFWTTLVMLPFRFTNTLRVAKEVEQKVLEGKETASFARVEIMNNGPPETFQFRI
eukprot:TRINITY_DN3140_c0_g1_i1.p1 TRINITY_DN3140_c0_g1~~TRINITY_DN3140_c0_g1_i1.p1  ORF type:complete len:463 (+),score=93.00 TRINITY_DN3140_c0_g1_i1:43-1389(+)